MNSNSSFILQGLIIYISSNFLTLIWLDQIRVYHAPLTLSWFSEPYKKYHQKFREFGQFLITRRTGDNGEVRLVTPLVCHVTQLSSQFDSGSQLSAIRRLWTKLENKYLIFCCVSLRYTPLLPIFVLYSSHISSNICILMVDWAEQF